MLERIKYAKFRKDQGLLEKERHISMSEKERDAGKEGNVGKKEGEGDAGKKRDAGKNRNAGKRPRHRAKNKDWKDQEITPKEKIQWTASRDNIKRQCQGEL